ncbi:MAG: hypothetical protein TR69_WS6001000578 [candidate division WS6 bacterium OLB20]|uniref:Uncharacterized protein n=1 Tax=candidate division WS6 bacterium OLB20 TaxID=1617426 RepID=A0A136LY33_9BACT|nr:MAG: hypothetical protein TR69_WS6001000578 [candidate division WS6 bacterium OLB20]
MPVPVVVRDCSKAEEGNCPDFDVYLTASDSQKAEMITGTFAGLSITQLGFLKAGDEVMILSEQNNSNSVTYTVFTEKQ